MKPVVLKSNLKYFGLVILYLLLQSFFITQVPDIQCDEPWYANTAYNFSQGQWFTNTNVGQYGGDFFIVYTFLLGIGIKLFGCTLCVTRMISIIGGVITMMGLIKILKTIKVSNIVSVLTVLMFIFSNVTYIIFRSTRPEGWILAFGIWSIFYLIKFIDNQKTQFIVYGSIFASLSFLCHPNGILFLIAISFYLIIYSIKKRNVSYLGYFALIAFIIITIHFIIVFSNSNTIRDFIFQVKTRNSLSDTNFNLYENLNNFFSVYTLGVKRLYILIFETGILLLGLLFSKKNILLRYLSFFGLLNLVLSLSFFSEYSSRHFGEIIIYSFLSFALLSELLINKKLRLVIIFLGAIYLINNLAGDIYIIYKKYKNTPYSLIEKHLKEIIPENSTVISPIYFWYPLKKTQFYNEFTRWEKKPYDNLDSLIQSGDVDYIVTTPSLIEGTTGTSGRAVIMLESTLKFYQKVTNSINKNVVLIDSMNTVGYDTLKIYKMKK
jgi:hypothetical protein